MYCIGNNLTGSIPTSISKLTSLRLLSLGEYTGGNAFTAGPLPEAFASLISLEALFMANCNLRGQLPSWIGRMKELRQLDLQHNELGGVIPTSISQCSNLLYLNLKDNGGLCGILPIQSFARLRKLNRLSLVNCNFNNTDEANQELQQLLPRCKVWF
jgi:Leucine-rich repeat (LRR) protein